MYLENEYIQAYTGMTYGPLDLYRLMQNHILQNPGTFLRAINIGMYYPGLPYPALLYFTLHRHKITSTRLASPYNIGLNFPIVVIRHFRKFIKHHFKKNSSVVPPNSLNYCQITQNSGACETLEGTN